MVHPLDPVHLHADGVNAAEGDTVQSLVQTADLRFGAAKLDLDSTRHVFGRPAQIRFLAGESLLEQDQLYLRIYVPETRIGRVRAGQRAEVRVDSFPGRVFQADVEQINQKAEFLPRNVQTREERVHQVFGVKLRIRDPEGRLRAGMAADVKLRDN